MLESISDSIIKWEVFSNEKLCEHFPLEEWKLMVSDIESDKEWGTFLHNYRDFIKCYVLYICKTKQEIGFVYLYNESKHFNVVSVHGGGWGKSTILSIMYYRGILLMIEYLLNQGRKVRTSCFVGNDRALRFLTSIGFVRYLTTENAYYMWINLKRLQNSKIYKYLKRENTKRDKPIKSVNKD